MKITFLLHLPLLPPILLACVCIGSHPSTSGISDFSLDDVLHYADDNVCSTKDDSDYSILDKVAFSKRFQEMINFVTGYFPNAKPSVPAHSVVRLLWEFTSTFSVRFP